jgi:hypothetical protein
MKIVEPGHVYDLNSLDDTEERPMRLIFVNREPGTEHPGTQTQEVLRALIDRTRHCDACLRWEGNDQIIYHLRMALVFHEMRALERKAEKGYYHPEYIPTGEDGHFKFEGEVIPNKAEIPKPFHKTNFADKPNFCAKLPLTYLERHVA